MKESLEEIVLDLGKEALFADIYIEEEDSFVLVLEPGERIEEISWGKDGGISIRRISPELKTEFWVSGGGAKHLPEKFSKKLEWIEKELLFQRKGSFIPGSFFIEKRLRFLKELVEKIPLDSKIRHYRIGLREITKKIWICNSEGKFVEEQRQYVRVGALIVVEENGRLETGYEVAGKRISFEEVMELEEFLEVSKIAAELALKMLKAKKAPAGIMPVVLAGEAGGTMIHEAVGHGLEADHAEAGLSVYSGRIGEKVASELITVVDDPTIEGLYGSYRWDDEGFPAEPVVLIENGVLKTYLYDRFTALKYGKKTNGHGRRENFRHIPIPRMSNTFIKPGTMKGEEIVKSIDKGLLVKKMGGGEVNPLTGDFVFEVREGYYVENGEICYPVKGATLVGNGPKVLEAIDMVGDRLFFEPGICGKDGQGVPVTDAQPTIRIPEITVSGTLGSD